MEFLWRTWSSLGRRGLPTSPSFPLHRWPFHASPRPTRLPPPQSHTLSICDLSTRKWRATAFLSAFQPLYRLQVTIIAFHRHSRPKYAVRRCGKRLTGVEYCYFWSERMVNVALSLGATTYRYSSTTSLTAVGLKERKNEVFRFTSAEQSCSVSLFTRSFCLWRLFLPSCVSPLGRPGKQLISGKPSSFSTGSL